MRRTGWWVVAAGCAAMLVGGMPPVGAEDGGYEQTNLVANWEAYNARIVEPEL